LGQESDPVGSLLMDIFVVFLQDFAEKVGQAQNAGGNTQAEEVKKALEMDGSRLFTREIVAALNQADGRPWWELLRGKEVTELWLSQRLRPYGIRPRMMRIGGE
jgi:hypothetical protein